MVLNPLRNQINDNIVEYNPIGSMDALKIQLLENPDGIYVRELVQNTYITLEN
jgi:hypothetical protein